MTPTANISAALVSVGGSPAPVLFTLRQHRPRHVWYFCSAGSRLIAEEIHAQLDWHPAPRFIEVERFEELGPCFGELRRKIPEILAEAKVAPADVIVDYTGGTKTMSAALVLVATEFFDHFSYVGGAQREKGGMGITVEGRERVLYQDNPWSTLAVREIERAVDLWSGLGFGHAAEILREVGRRSMRKLPATLAELADSLAARHRLDFAGARNRLDRLGKPLELLLDSTPGHPLLDAVRRMTDLCRRCAPDQADGPALLRELLDNAIRTARQQRYEDAAARLYRAMEMQGHSWLAEATGGLFVNGRCRPEHTGQIPEALRSLPFCQPAVAGGTVDLSMELSFRALHALGDGRVARVIEDIAKADAGSKSASRWRRATEKRNTSILAHGTQPIGQDGFESMKTIATEFLGFELDREANPMPPLDPRWF